MAEPSGPESMLPKRVQQLLEETLNKALDEAIKTDDMAQATDLQRAKKLVHRGCYTIRKENPYIGFMGECLLEKGGTLEDTQKAMKECAEKWSQLPEDKKKGKEGLAAYDYL